MAALLNAATTPLHCKHTYDIDFFLLACIIVFASGRKVNSGSQQRGLGS